MGDGHRRGMFTTLVTLMFRVLNVKKYTVRMASRVTNAAPLYDHSSNEFDRLKRTYAHFRRLDSVPRSKYRLALSLCFWMNNEHSTSAIYPFVILSNSMYTHRAPEQSGGGQQLKR